MLSVLLSSSVVGIDAEIVRVEVDVKRGMPAFNIVGLPDTAVRESKQRIVTALRNSGFKFPAKRVTVNLAPADLKKEGASFDLAMALGVLMSTEQVQFCNLTDTLILGELSLSGELRVVKGILPSVIRAMKNKIENVILPKDNANQASIVNNLNIYPVNSLREAIDFCVGEKQLKKHSVSLIDEYNKNKSYKHVDFKDVKGQFFVKRALEIAAAGGHNMLMIGPPGAGKSMLAKRLPTILPEMTLDESLESTKIHSVAGVLPKDISFLVNRPFRSPHHTSSDIALIGGGSSPRPGEVSLAHNGVLFLDELPEFKRNVLEVLRQPLEDGSVVISRAVRSLSYPANVMFVAAMNPCPCGYYGGDNSECVCSEKQIRRYLNKISGPLLDRIDIHIRVPKITYEELVDKNTGESSDILRKRVRHAREIQIERFYSTSIYTNSNMNSNNLKKYCKLDINGEDVIKFSVKKFDLSARAYTKILKVARTIADLDGAQDIEKEHITEALQYRLLDRNWWRV